MEIQISKDLRKYKVKDVGAFSYKEAGFLALGAGLGFAIYKLTGSVDVAVFPAIVCVGLGFIKPFGYTIPQFLRTVVKDSLRPLTYINETNFVYDEDFIRKMYFDDGEIEPNKVSPEWFIQNQPPQNKLSKEEERYVI